jgi:hypothetical protein
LLLEEQESEFLVDIQLQYFANIAYLSWNKLFNLHGWMQYRVQEIASELDWSMISIDDGDGNLPKLFE